MIAAVAAGHPATADAGAAVLADGGNAADAAVAACLASCVAETIMTGLLGGGHAIYHDATTGISRNLDCFVAVPSGTGQPMVELAARFGEEVVDYTIGASSCAVPGVPAGLEALWRGYGRLPWPRLVEPALELARRGVPMPEAHAACLAMLEPLFTMREGADIYAPGGRLLEPGDRLEQPGLVRALELLRDEGVASFYTGSIAKSLLGLSRERGGCLTESDLASYEALWSEPVEVSWSGKRILTRRGLSGVAEALARLAPTGGPAALFEALTADCGGGHTTNLCVLDEDGNACVLTTSLGIGSGDWLPGLDLHLNSMLGELDLVGREPLAAGARVGSMMAPSLAFGPQGVELAIGAAGGTRLRTALVQVTAGILGEGLDPQEAVDRPRFHPTPTHVNAEPGVDDSFLNGLEERGYRVRRWSTRHHYFGGVSAIGRSAAAADPRRSGAVRVLA